MLLLVLWLPLFVHVDIHGTLQLTAALTDDLVLLTDLEKLWIDQ